jgi:hypothetical protein
VICMAPKLVALLVILVVASSTGTILLLASLSQASGKGEGGSEIICPKDGSLYVWTPIGSRSENFNWRCLQCGYTWTRSFREETYQAWRNASLEPSFVRDYTLLYLRAVLQLGVPDPFTLNWTGGRGTPEGIAGYEDYVYRGDGTVVFIGYPVVLPENTIHTIKVEVEGITIWEGTLHRRQFIKSEEPAQNEPRTIYDYYGGVGVFEKGIHVIATDYNPLTLNCTNVEDYWRWLREKETLKASSDDFISIIISRGNFSTGGYTIQIKSSSWLESYPVKLRFEVNFTDPGEGVAVTEAFTNPLVLVPLGKLSPGEYVVEVHIDRYILTFDDKGRPVYTLLQTFKEELWQKTFVIE